MKNRGKQFLLPGNLLRRYFVPYEVVRHTSPIYYAVRVVMPSRSMRGKVEDVLHVPRMEPYNAPVAPP